MKIAEYYKTEKISLTDVQVKLIAFLYQYRETHGSLPTHEEICSEMNWNSRGSSNYQVNKLKELQIVNRDSSGTNILNDFYALKSERVREEIKRREGLKEVA